MASNMRFGVVLLAVVLAALAEDITSTVGGDESTSVTASTDTFPSSSGDDLSTPRPTSVHTGLYAILTHVRTETSVGSEVTSVPEQAVEQPVLLDSDNELNWTSTTSMREFSYPLKPSGTGVGFYKEVSLSGRPLSQATREGRSFSGVQTEASASSGSCQVTQSVVMAAAVMIHLRWTLIC